MLDQLIIGEKASLEDFDASLAERSIDAPVKKSIKETVPFSNVTYDFSAINGEVYWEERKLEYVFEIIADTPEKLERKKASFCNWVMNVMNEPIYDPYEPGWHYNGTFDSIKFNDDESVEKTTITVIFAAYPYKIANELTVHSFVIPASSTVEKSIFNASSHRVTPTIIASAPVVLTIGTVSYAIPTGEVTDDSVKIQTGNVGLTIVNQSNTECTLDIEYYKEVF